MAQRGRPKVHGERVVTAIRMDPKLMKRVKIEALHRDVSANLLISKAVEDWLKKNEGKVKL